MIYVLVKNYGYEGLRICGVSDNFAVADAWCKGESMNEVAEMAMGHINSFGIATGELENKSATTPSAP